MNFKKVCAAYILHLATLIIFSTPSSAADKLTISDFIEKVKNENPEINIQNASVKISSAIAKGNNFPSGMLGYMKMQSSGNSNNGFEIVQDVPLPTKIMQDKKIRKSSFEYQKESSSIEKSLILAQAKFAYVDYWAANARLAILREKHTWLKNHSRLYDSTTFSDNQSKIHLLGIESEIDSLANDIFSAESDLVEKRNILNIFAPSISNQEIIASEPPIENLQIDINKNSIIRLREQDLKTKSAELEMAKQNFLPDLTFRLRSYSGNSSSPGSNEFMVGMTLPFLNIWQSTSEIQKAKLEKSRTKFELEKTSNETLQMTKSSIDRASSLKKQLSILKNNLIPNAKKRLELSSNLSVKTVDGLENHKNIMMDYLDLRLNSVQLRLDYEKNFENIVQYTGVNN